jgi:hypothetical protein
MQTAKMRTALSAWTTYTYPAYSGQSRADPHIGSLYGGPVTGDYRVIIFWSSNAKCWPNSTLKSGTAQTVGAVYDSPTAFNREMRCLYSQPGSTTGFTVFGQHWEYSTSDGTTGHNPDWGNGDPFLFTSGGANVWAARWVLCFTRWSDFRFRYGSNKSPVGGFVYQNHGAAPGAGGSLLAGGSPGPRAYAIDAFCTIGFNTGNANTLDLGVQEDDEAPITLWRPSPSIDRARDFNGQPAVDGPCIAMHMEPTRSIPVGQPPRSFIANQAITNGAWSLRFQVEGRPRFNPSVSM